MDTDTLVTERIESGQLLVDALRNSRFDVTAAFWVQTSEDELWHMYIATSLVENEGLAAAYRQLHPVLRSIPNSWVLESNVRLIGRTSPIAQAVLKFKSNWPAMMPVRSKARQLGNLVIDELYIYP